MLENIYSGVNFCGKNACGNFYLRELIFAPLWKNRKNSNLQKFRAIQQTISKMGVDKTQNMEHPGTWKN